MLEDDSISKSLQVTKKEAAEAQDRQNQAMELCEKLEQSSSLYKGAAEIASALYFALGRL